MLDVIRQVQSTVGTLNCLYTAYMPNSVYNVSGGKSVWLLYNAQG